MPLLLVWVPPPPQVTLQGDHVLHVSQIQSKGFASEIKKTMTRLKLVAIHTIYTRNNMGQKCEGNCGLWVLNEILKKTSPENLKKIVGAFGSYLLNSTANPAHFHSNWAGLAMLFSR